MLEVTYHLNGKHRCGHTHSLTGAIECARSIARHTPARSIRALRSDGSVAVFICADPRGSYAVTAGGTIGIKA